MTFLRNAWYCVGFSDTLAAGTVQSITALGEPLALFRDAAGTFSAVADRCPHRFARLSSGQAIDGALACPYHGLRFDAQGHCVLNPHGEGKIPQAAKVRSYPTLERHGSLWVWMGDAALADPSRLPDFSMIEERPGWTRVQGQLKVQANYQLVIDNLLDLTHVEYLHPFLASRAPRPPEFRSHIALEQDGNTVTSINEQSSAPANGIYQMLWERGEPPRYIDTRGNMRWHPPSLLYLDTGATYVGASRTDGPTLETAHWLTPETATTTHYFWIATRDRWVGHAGISEQLRAGMDGAFRGEDEPMIEAIQQQMGEHDLLDLQPVLLPTDGAAIRARRMLKQLIEQEQQQAR